MSARSLSSFSTRWQSPGATEPHLTRLRDTAFLELHFAVDDLLPISTLTTVLATPGAGRTTLSCMLAAATHAPFYQQDDQPTVLMVNAMHDPGLEIRPRFLQLGMNLDRVNILDHVYDPDPKAPHHRRPYNIDDLDSIKRELSNHKSYSLLVIDSIELFLKLPSKPNRRKVLEQLYRLADIAITHNIAVLLMTTTAQLRPNPFTSTFLSALSEASRTCYILDRDEKGRRLLLPYKNVLAFPTPTRRLANLPDLNVSAFRSPLSALSTPDPSATCSSSQKSEDSEFSNLSSEISNLKSEMPNPASPDPSQSEIEIRNSKILGDDLRSIQARSLFTDVPTITYASHLSKPYIKPGPKPHAQDFACEVLTQILKPGPLPLGNDDNPLPGTLIHELKLANVSLASAKRVKPALGIQSSRTGDVWYWHLPTPEPEPEISNLQSAISNPRSEICNLKSGLPSPSEAAPSTQHELPIPSTPETRAPSTKPGDPADP